MRLFNKYLDKILNIFGLEQLHLRISWLFIEFGITYTLTAKSIATMGFFFSMKIQYLNLFLFPFFPSSSSYLKGVFIFSCKADDIGVKEKEMEHSNLKEKLGKELKELDQKLEEKEVCCTMNACS